MRGLPSNLATKQDYLYIKENFAPEQWVPYWQALLDTRKDWFNTGVLEKKSDGKDDGGVNYRIEETKMEVPQEDGTTKEVTQYSQYELKDNPNSLFKTLGFTVKEIKDAIKNAK